MRTQNKIFISYCHKDEEWKDRFKPHLLMLEKSGQDIIVWDDRKINAGNQWYQDIKDAMEQSKVAVCLISADYLASDFCIKEEIPFLLEKQKDDGMILIPILIRPCLWKAFSWLNASQMLPRDGKSIIVDFSTKFDLVFTEVAETIFNIINNPSNFPSNQVLSNFKMPKKYDLQRMPFTGAELFGRQKMIELLDKAWNSKEMTMLNFVAWGGVGKTTLVNKWLNTMKKDNFRGAEYVFAWSFYSQGTNERVTSADQFINEALIFFDDPNPKKGSPWEKGKRLANLVCKHRALLVLDGLEPLQYSNSFDKGKIKDPALDLFLKSIANGIESDFYPNSKVLCLLTSRQALPFADQFNNSFYQVNLELFTKEVGRSILRVKGIRGTDFELEQASIDFGNHALALNLLGTYLREVKGHHVSNVNEISNIDIPEKKGKHARRVIEAFEKKFTKTNKCSYIELMNILGLFDRPATIKAIEAISMHLIPDLTENIQNLTELEYYKMLHNLRELGLISYKSYSSTDVIDVIDSHPLVREHFGEKLKKRNMQSWKFAHNKLYEFYKNLPQKKYPNTLEEMEPLFFAVMHGCLAGNHLEALIDIYFERIYRKTDKYLVYNLGAFSYDLSLLSFFFKKPWSKTSIEDDKACSAGILNWAGFALRALGRISEAIKPMQLSLEIRIQQEDWKEASINSGNLSEFYLTLGNVKEAACLALQSVTFADKSGDAFERESKRTTLAYSLHQAGEIHDAEKYFREAESMLKNRQSKYTHLHSLWGYRFCDFLLTNNKLYAEVKERALLSLKWAKQDNIIKDIAFAYLALGQSYSLQATNEENDYSIYAEKYLNNALNGFREAGRQDYLPRVLLELASLYRNLKKINIAMEHLFEAQEIAMHSQMKLYLIDFHVESCFVIIEKIKLEIGKLVDLRRKLSEHFALAVVMKEKAGYKRRNIDFESIAKWI